MAQRGDDGRTVMVAKELSQAPNSSDIATFLKQNPDFFMHHPDVLELIKLPAKNQGNRIVDLHQFIVGKLRRDVAKLKAEQEEFIANTRDNVHTQQRIHQAILKLIQADTLNNLLQIICGDLPVLLEVDRAIFCLERTQKNYRHLQDMPVRFLKPGSVDKILGSAEQNIILRDDIQGDDLLYSSGTSLSQVRSDALLRVNLKQVKGLLVFATRHPGYFDADQGTDFLEFMAKVIEITLQPHF